MADSCSYPILGHPLRNLGLLLSRKLSVRFPPQLLCRLLLLALHAGSTHCTSVLAKEIADDGMSLASAPWESGTFSTS